MTARGVTEVRYRYAGNPAKYCADEASIVLAIDADESPAEALCAARAIVHTTLGLATTKKDRLAARAYLRRHYGDRTKLADFAPEDG